MSFDGVSNDQLLDLLKTTLPAYPWDGQYEYLQKYTTYPTVNKLFKGEKPEMQTGTAVKFNVTVKETGNFKWIRPYQTNEVSVADVQVQGTVPWTYAQTNWSIERHEMLQNMGKPEKLVDLIKIRRQDGLMDMANNLEEQVWKKQDSITDDLHPYGFPYWFTPITAAQASSGFNGSVGTAADGGTYTTKAGLSPATHTRAKNYNFRWANSDGSIVPADIKEMRTAFRKCSFVSPVIVDDLKDGPLSNLRFYAGDTLINNFEELALKLNDNIGPDVGKFAGSTTFKGIPFVYVPVLDSDTTYPLFGVNHNHFNVVLLEGDNFRETGPLNDRQQHDVFTTFVNLTYNTICRNLQRAGFVGSYVAYTG